MSSNFHSNLMIEKKKSHINYIIYDFKEHPMISIFTTIWNLKLSRLWTECITNMSLSSNADFMRHDIGSRCTEDWFFDLGNIHFRLYLLFALRKKPRLILTFFCFCGACFLVFSFFSNSLWWGLNRFCFIFGSNIFLRMKPAVGLPNRCLWVYDIIFAFSL